MSRDDMGRKMARRVFQARTDRLKKKIRELPLTEKFRIVADFIDRGDRKWALAVARHALAELEAAR